MISALIDQYHQWIPVVKGDCFRVKVKGQGSRVKGQRSRVTSGSFFVLTTSGFFFGVTTSGSFFVLTTSGSKRG